MKTDVTIEDFVLQYTNAINYRLRSYKQILGHLKRIELYFSGRTIESICRSDMIKYIVQRQNQGVSPASINIELIVFSSSINYSKKYFDLDFVNPVTGLCFPVKPGRLRYLERQEAARLIAVARESRSPNLADFIELALNTGARKNELLQLQFRSIDFGRRIMTIEGHTAKTGKRRYLPINRTAYDALARRLGYNEKKCPKSPWVFSKSSGARAKTLDGSFYCAVKKAGLDDFHIHDLRHTFASWLVTEGVDLIKVRDLLGHTSISMTERYAHLAPFRLHEAVAVLDRYAIQDNLF